MKLLSKFLNQSLLFAVVVATPGQLLADYERAEDLKASEILSTEQVSGAHFSVDERVESDGYLNYYTIRSDYGVFEAASTAMLLVRLKEIDALAQLDELSSTEVFVNAAADAGLGQIEVISTFVQRPVSTLAGLPQGVSRMFKRYSRQLGEAVSDTKEYMATQKELGLSDREYADYKNNAISLTERYFNISAAERDLAQELGTDPYTSNETLSEAIKKVAWVDRMGRVAVKVAGKVAGLSIPYVGVLAKVNDAVWGKDPYELRDYNRARLLATGATEELVDAYLKNPWMSPTQQTVLTAAIGELTEVTGSDGILRQARDLRTPVEVGYFVRSVALLAWYHSKKQPLASVSTELAIPGGIRADGTTVLLFPSDYVYWTETMAQAAREFRALGAGNPDLKPELWILGSVSKRAQTELHKLGYDLNTEFADQLLGESS